MEFGLIRDGAGLKLYGAGHRLLRRRIALRHRQRLAESPAVRPAAHHAHKYRIDDFQQNYFVIDSFDQLLRETLDTDFGPLYAELETQPEIEISAILPTDQVLTRGTQSHVARGSVDWNSRN